MTEEIWQLRTVEDAWEIVSRYLWLAGGRDEEGPKVSTTSGVPAMPRDNEGGGGGGDAEGVEATRVAIVGSRGYPDLPSVREFVATLPTGTFIISGGAKGVDSTAQKAARDLGYPMEQILPDWLKHGRAAGLLRNSTIVERAHKVVAFWDGRSKGTLDTIKKASKAGKLWRVFKCE